MFSDINEDGVSLVFVMGGSVWFYTGNEFSAGWFSPFTFLQMFDITPTKRDYSEHSTWMGWDEGTGVKLEITCPL